MGVKGQGLEDYFDSLELYMLGLSTPWQLCSFFVIPEVIIKAANGEIFPFVWRKKREWLARSSVTLSHTTT
jgi:hypothetical protein